MDKAVSGLFIFAGIIHLLPVPGVLGVERLSVLYGIALDEPNLMILMRHRSALFGLLGLFLICAGFRQSLQPMALSAGLLSVMSFILIAWSVGSYNEAVRRVVMADVFALVALCVAGVMCVFSRN